MHSVGPVFIRRAWKSRSTILFLPECYENTMNFARMPWQKRCIGMWKDWQWPRSMNTRYYRYRANRSLKHCNFPLMSEQGFSQWEKTLYNITILGRKGIYFTWVAASYRGEARYIWINASQCSLKLNFIWASFEFGRNFRLDETMAVWPVSCFGWKPPVLIPSHKWPPST